MNTGHAVGEDTKGIPAMHTICQDKEYASYIDLPVIPSKYASVHTASIPFHHRLEPLREFFPGQDAIVVGRLKKADAIVIGKTHTPEFCLMVTTDNPLFGVTRKPWKLDYTPGAAFELVSPWANKFPPLE